MVLARGGPMSRKPDHKGKESQIRTFWRRIRFRYWHTTDSWPFLIVSRFFKALLLMGLWLIPAIFLSRLLSKLFPEIKPADRETTALLTALLTALIGFGIQQWKGLEEEEERRHHKREEALNAIGDLIALLQKNPSEGARKYLELSQKGGIWQSGYIKAALEEAWEKQAPEELQIVVKVLEGSPRPSQLTTQMLNALHWAEAHLDEDWRHQVRDVFSEMGTGPPLGDRLWLALQKAWLPASQKFRRVEHADWEQILGLQYLGLKRNPFGPEKAEAEPLRLRDIRVSPSWWNEVQQAKSGIFITDPGGGRTTTALLLAYDALLEGTALPVYWPIATRAIILDTLVRTVAQTLAYLIAARPTLFTSSPHSSRIAVARLLIGCLTDPLQYLSRGGLPSTGEGQRVWNEIQSHIHDPCISHPADYFPLLGDVHLNDFPCILILADAQQDIEEASLVALWALKGLLEHKDIAIKCFLPASALTEQLGKKLCWSDKDLEELIKRRFALLSPGESLGAWCDMRTWEGPSAQDRLIAAARGNPARLIQMGNNLLRWIGRNQRLLTPEDVDTVLTP